MPIDCGWDVGGVHLKVACLRGGLEAEPRIAVRQEPFEIWRSPDRLAARLSELLEEVLAEVGSEAGVPAAAPAHAVTMTAELSDVFPDKRSGVRAILAACEQALAPPMGAGAIRVLGTSRASGSGRRRARSRTSSPRPTGRPRPGSRRALLPPPLS